MEPLVEKVFVHDCPHCQKTHVHQIMVEFSDVGIPTPFFAGKTASEDGENTLNECRITLKCPNSGLPVQRNVKISVPSGETIKVIKEITERTPYTEYSNKSVINYEDEYDVWRKQSILTIRSFAEKLVNINLSSIGLVVAVLTFLSTQGQLAAGTETAILFAVCFGVYLVSIIFSILIIVPNFINPQKMSEFMQKKQRMGKRLHIFSVLAVGFYIIALLLSLVILLCVLLL